MVVNGHSRINVSGRGFVAVAEANSILWTVFCCSASGLLLPSSGTQGSMLDWHESAFGDDDDAMAGSEQIDS